MRPAIIFLLIVAAAAFCAYGFMRWASISQFIQAGDSMIPTIKPKDVVVVDRKAYCLRSPKRFDLVAFRFGGRSNVVVVFRVAGMPGETITIHSNGIAINGKDVPMPGNILTMPVSVGVFKSSNSFTIPERTYFLIGDNGLNARDSRYFGVVKREDVIGKASVLK